MTQEDFFKRYTYNLRDDCIGGGGFGTVYKAMDNLLHRTVAIKVSKVKTSTDGKKIFSLKDEFEVLKNVPKHPNIANYEEFYSFESPQGVFDYAIMQYYCDGNLSNIIKQGLTMDQKKDIAKQLLEGVAFLHQHKVVHRDLKPSNVLVVREGNRIIPLITDFGLSKVAGMVDGSVFSNSFGGGTPRYSSPEQLQGRPLRFNTDLWSYGAILFELFTGEQLFCPTNAAANTAQAEVEIYQKIINGNVEGLNRLDNPWRQIVSRCMVVSSELRVKRAEDLLGMLDETTSVKKKPSRIDKVSDETTSSPQIKEKSTKTVDDDRAQKGGGKGVLVPLLSVMVVLLGAVLCGLIIKMNAKTDKFVAVYTDKLNKLDFHFDNMVQDKDGKAGNVLFVLPALDLLKEIEEMEKGSAFKRSGLKPCFNEKFLVYKTKLKEAQLVLVRSIQEQVERGLNRDDNDYYLDMCERLNLMRNLLEQAEQGSASAIQKPQRKEKSNK